MTVSNEAAVVQATILARRQQDTADAAAAEQVAVIADLQSREDERQAVEAEQVRWWLTCVNK